MLRSSLPTRINNRASKRAAFTLMEMLVVVAIIVALAAVGGYYLLGQLGASQESTARTQMQVLTKACKTYFIRNNQWPPNWEALLNPDSKNGGEPYLEDNSYLTDPWGGTYKYEGPAVPAGKRFPRISTTTPKGATIDNYQKG
ncbi:MAG: type II secretion system protein [Gemmataceae bacterium]